MSNRYPNLMAPIRVGKHILKNRIIVAPSTLHSASNGEPYPNEEAMAFFEERAKSGAGMVTVAGVGLAPVSDDGMHASWDLYKPNSTNALALLAERIHFYGAKASMELLCLFGDGYAVSDGAMQMNFEPGKEIPVSEMDKYKGYFATAAETLMNLGYDGLLLHFGHSIPVAQFLSPLTNKRTDQYGGSTENRVRYINEILTAIREKVKDHMIIEVRMSGSEFEEGGIDIEEGLKIAEMIQDKIDILQVSAGMHHPKWMTVTHPCGFLPPNPNVFLAEAFKKSGRITVPVTTIGGIGNLDDAEEIISSGKADFVAISRALIADPELIKKYCEGNGEDVTPCIKCMRCHDSTVFGRHFICAVNPVVGLHHLIDKMITAPTGKKSIAIIGGGPAGMKAAVTAYDRGHSVTIFEKSGSLGGALKFSDYVSFKYPLKGYKDFLIRQVEKRNIAVKLNTTAEPEALKSQGYDAVFAAIGAEPIKPPIQGIDTANVIMATDCYGKEGQLGDTVVVIGGGQVGCETALHLAKHGKKVALLEMQEVIAPDASTTHRDELMHEFSKEPNLTIITGGRCTSLSETCVTYTDSEGNSKQLDTDSIIIAVGMKPLNPDRFMGLSDSFTAIGDCAKVGTVETAVRNGFYSAVTL